MRSIIVGFSTPRDFHTLAWLIRKGEGTEYSHVYVKFRSDSLDRSFIYQASGMSLNFMNIQTFLEKNKVIEEYSIVISEDEHLNILRYCLDTVGSPYAKLQLVGHGLVRLAKIWFGKKVKNPWKDGEKRQVCLELVANILKFLGSNADKSAEDGDLKWINAVVRQIHQERASLLH